MRRKLCTKWNGPFELIKNGTKTIEIRLNDEKRSLIKEGDIIEFENRITKEKLKTKVIKLYKFDNFEESECLKRIRQTNASLPMNKKVTTVFAMRDALPRTGKGEVARFRMAEEVTKRTEGVKKINMKGRKI